MKIIFWCEFPDKVDWNKVKRLIDFNTEIYVTCKTKREYLKWKKKIETKFITVGAWPILSIKDGYWFSGFVDKKSIDKLDQFKWIKIKIDIEPPIWTGKYRFVRLMRYLIKHSLRSGKNNDYLKAKIKELKADIIISGFYLPRFVRRRYGADITKGKTNYMFYTSFTPKFLRPLLRQLIKFLISFEDKKNCFAIGLISHGIYGNEPIYEDIKEFQKDLEMMTNLKVKNLAIFTIEGIMNKKDKESWLNLVRKFIVS